MLKNIRKKQGGFTLLELLIVIVIIGILALLILPNITSAPKKARDTQRKTDLRAVQKGLEEYFVSNNAYPIVTTAGAVDSVLATSLSNSAGGATPIIKTLPKDPNHTATTPYIYQSATDGSSYTLNACLENAGDNGTGTLAGSSYGAGCSTRDFQLVNNN